MKEVQVVRIYMMEGEHLLNQVLSLLHDKIKIQHATVFRATQGFEKGGEVHSSQIMSLSLNLPLIVEFFDKPDQVAKALPLLKKILPEGHIISFSAKLS